ncbi:MAG: DASS family sodium-coupled anion symporter [Balneolales bacterium]|nr:DASS family sodium-coupled anion symporter [Balneolales bacterium]
MSELKSDYGPRQKYGLIGGLILFLVLVFLPAPAGLSQAGWYTAAVAILMATWWVTEALPIPATALLPIVLFPLLEVSSVREATTPFANPLIYLFMGGFIIAIGMEKSELHRRVALNVVRFVGTSPHHIVAGFMLAAAFLSMWVSNTATALMMLPIALSVIHLVEDKKDVREQNLQHNFSLCLVLCIAYGCNVGGMGTLIGTPPNALMAGFMLENYQIEISFAQWMLIGVPLVIVSLPIIFIVLTKVLFPIQLKEIPGGRHLIYTQLKEIGKMSVRERIVATVFILTATMWIFQQYIVKYVPEVSDTVIAIFGALLLFLIPVDFKKGDFVLGWDDAKRLPWDILVLFGGGLSLAAAISSTGLASWMGESLRALDTWPVLALILLSLTLIIFLTEVTSNTATAAAFMPILASVALAFNLDPLILVVPAALGASCAFMLPVATPPNAIVYGSGFISMPQMAKAGFWLNIIMIIVITLMMYILLGYVFSIEL